MAGAEKNDVNFDKLLVEPYARPSALVPLCSNPEMRLVVSRESKTWKWFDKSMCFGFSFWRLLFWWSLVAVLTWAFELWLFFRIFVTLEGSLIKAATYTLYRVLIIYFWSWIYFGHIVRYYMRDCAEKLPYSVEMKGIVVPMQIAFGSIYFYGAYYGTNRYKSPQLMLVVIVFYVVFFVLWPIFLWSRYGAKKSSIVRTLKLQALTILGAAVLTNGIRWLFKNMGSIKRAVRFALGSGYAADVLCDWFVLSFLTGVLIPAIMKVNNMVCSGNIGASGRVTISLGLRSLKMYNAIKINTTIGTHMLKFLIVRFHMAQFNPFVSVIFTVKDLVYAFIHFGTRAQVAFILSVLVHERSVYDPEANVPRRLKESGAICNSLDEEFVALPAAFKKWKIIFKWSVDWVPRWTRILFPHLIRYPLSELCEGSLPSDRIDDDMGTSLAVGFGPCYTLVASLPPSLVDCDSLGESFFQEFQQKTQADHQMWNKALQLWASSGFGYSKKSEQNSEDVANAQCIGGDFLPLCNQEGNDTVLKSSFGNFSRRQAMVCSPIVISISFLNYYTFTSRASNKLLSAYLLFFTQTVIQHFFVYDEETGDIVSDHPATCDFRKWQHANALRIATGVLLVDLLETYILLWHQRNTLKNYFGVSIQATVDRWCIAFVQHRWCSESSALATWWFFVGPQNGITNNFWPLCKTVYN